MKRKNIILVLGFWAAVFGLNAQSFDPVNHKEVALNMTPLIWTLAPLNVNDLPIQTYNFKYRRVKNGRIFTFAMGSNIDSDRDIKDFNLLLGREQRRGLGKDWYYSIGHNFVTGANNLNGIRDNDFFDPEIYLGYAMNYGIEYNITQQISVYTQASLFIGLSSTSFITVRFEAPISLFFNVKF